MATRYVVSREAQVQDMLESVVRIVEDAQVIAEVRFDPFLHVPVTFVNLLPTKLTLPSYRCLSPHLVLNLLFI